MAGLASTPAFGQQGPTGTGPSFTARPGRKYVPDHVLVRFRPGLPAEARASSHAQLGGDVLRRYRSVPGLELVKIPAGLRVREAIRVYKNNPNILYAEPDYIVRALETTPNDTSFTTLWAMKNTGQSGGTVDADIDATNAWDLSTGSTSVVVGVIDTGVDFNHPDLVGNIFNNLPECTGTPGVDDDDNDYVDDCLGINPSYREPDPFDDNNHGTHVSGTIGARGNNAVGVVGVNWQVKILACKFLNVDGFGSDSNAIACLDYMAMMKDRGVNIVATNNSWGGGGFSLALYEAIQAQMNRGILFIAAAGNGGADSIGDDNDVGEEFPANFDLPNIISVAATSRTDALGSFSNFGRHTVHLGAPGVAILSTTPNNFYQSFDGTSMATPHVTGAAALLKAQNPALDWIAIKNRILAGGDTKPAVSNTISQKRLNVFGAMTCSNKVLLTPLRPARSTTTAAVGAPVTLAALHINCAAPNGNVAVTVSPGGGTVTLLDNGNAPDQVAGDGIYSGQWVPSAAGSYTLGFPNGNNATVIVLRPYNSGPTSFSYRNITGTNLNLGDDQTAQVTPGFSILFGGTSFSKVFVSSNGLVSLDGAFDSFINEALPVSRANTIVAPWWDDLMPQPGTSQNVFWAVTGSTPNRQLVVEWRNVPHFSFSPVLSETVKFQTVFFENKSDILFNYADVTFGGDSALSDQGSSATVGVQVSGTEANEFSFETPTLSDNSAILWQNSPGYNILISDSSQSIYPGQTAVYHGTLSFNNGYVGTVSLLCASGSTSVPSKCSVSPASLSGSGDITITVSDSALQDFNFNVHAIGNDANQVTNDVPLMLHVADFIFQDLIPSSFDLPDGTTSNAIGAQMVSAPGSAFTDIVSVSCGSGLPPGATCTFFPALVDMNTPVSPHQAHFSISLGPSTPLGTYNVTVLADSAGAPAPKQKTLTINVTANPDFVLRSTPPRFDLVRGGSVTATVGNVQQDGFNSAVDLSCFALSAGVSCSFATNPMPANGTSAVTLSVSSSATDSSSIKIQGSASGKSHDLYVGYQLLDFVPSATPTTASVPVGKSASYTVGMIPTPSFGFVVPMTVGCTGLAAGMTCSASPASITPGVTSTVTVTTTVGVTPVATNNFSITGTAQGVTKTTSVQLTTTDPPLKAVSVTPSSGTGSSQTFAFLYSHTGGADKISYVQALINATNSWQKACAILYIRSANQLYLVLDNGSGWQGPLTPGQAGTLQNTQCTLNAGTSSVSAVGNNLTVNAALSFKPAFSGNKVVLLDAEDTVNHLSSGFQSLGTWTVPAAAPTAVSVTPNAGTGSSQTFSFLFSDASGANKISYVQALINSSNSWQKACAVLYIQNGNKLYLVLDNGTGWQGPLTPGVAGTLQNTQCTLNAGASSVSAVGNNLTVNAALSFKPAFGGNKVVLLDAEDTINHLSSGFQSLGTWTVPVAAPTAVSVTPNSGTGSSQTFSFLYSDAGGVGRITYAQALINSSHSWRNACAILYIQNGNKLYLVLDSGTGWQGPLTPGIPGTLQNSQCTLNAGASSVSAVGNNLTVNAALSFKPAFSGNKVVLLDAEDTVNHLSSGFQSLGTWTVPVSAPTAVSVTPSSGSGTTQTFSFLYSDAGGVGRITYAQALINSSHSWQKACAVLYMQNGNKLYLVLDSGTGWQGPLTPGQAGTLQNSQCTLDAGTSSVSAVGNNLTVNAALTFKPAFSGSKVVLLDAEDTVNHLSSGFQSLGTWTVP